MQCGYETSASFRDHFTSRQDGLMRGAAALAAAEAMHISQQPQPNAFCAWMQPKQQPHMHCFSHCTGLPERQSLMHVLL